MNPVTIFSLVPMELKFKSPSMHPQECRIPESDAYIPECVVIKEPSHYAVSTSTDLDYYIPVEPAKVAQSYVEKWLNSAYFSHNHSPGLWIMSGEQSAADIEQELYEERFKENIKWMHECVVHADQEYMRSNENPLSVTRLAKRCAAILNLDRPWKATKKEAVPNLKKVLLDGSKKANRSRGNRGDSGDSE